MEHLVFFSLSDARRMRECCVELLQMQLFPRDRDYLAELTAIIVENGKQVELVPIKFDERR